MIGAFLNLSLAEGLSLGALLVQYIPLLGMVGAPVIAAIVVNQKTRSRLDRAL